MRSGLRGVAARAPGALATAAALALCACSTEPSFGEAASGTASSTAATATSGETAAQATSGSSSTSGRGSGGSGDGGAGAGAGGDGPAGPGAGGEGGTDDPCAAVHVSPAGDDGATGCADAPLLTIQRGLALANRSGKSDVLVCAGTFTEDVTFEQATALRGSFDCDTWNADTILTTTIAGVGVEAATVVIGAPADTRGEQRFEGFVVEAADYDIDSGLSSVALQITGGASVVRNVRAVAGAGMDVDGPGSIGIRVTDGTADLGDVEADGGSGMSATSYGSVGILVEGGTPHLHDASSFGGTGIGIYGSNALGLINVALEEGALERLTLDGGDGLATGAVAGGFLSTGIAAVGATFTLTDSDVDGGRGTYSPQSQSDCNAEIAFMAGIFATGSTVALRGDRIWGGTTALDSPGTFAHSGAHFFDSDVTIDDSAIMSGSVSVTGTCYASGRGVWFDSGALTVRRSSLVAEGNNPDALIVAYPTSVTVDDDLLVALPTSGDGFGLTWVPEPCSDNPVELTSLRRNAFVGPGAVAYFGCVTNTVYHEHLPAFFDEIDCDAPEARVAGNVELSSDCSPFVAECRQVAECADSDTCAPAIFEGWDESDAGRSSLFTRGLELAVGLPCAVTDGSGDCNGDDILDDPHTSPCSMGANEGDDECSGDVVPQSDQMGTCPG